jgi:hypothetical protein
MSALEAQQRGLLALLKNRATPTDDPYLRRVAQSRELALLRMIALWWRTFALEAQCRFTVRLLKRRGSFAADVACYFDGNATSAFAEELSLGFLAALREHEDPLVCAVARFEHALLALRAGDVDGCEIPWDRNPDQVVVALETGGELPPPDPGGLYLMRVARDLPGLVACTRETTAITPADSL